jgi:hypothetical protein
MIKKLAIGFAVVVVAAAVIIWVLLPHHTANPAAGSDGNHPDQAARLLLEAFAKEDWAQAATFWPAARPPMDDRLKTAVAGLQIVRLDKPQKKQPPFKVGVYDGPWQPGAGDPWMPYEIRFKNGATQKADLRLSWDGSHWQLAGGL